MTTIHGGWSDYVEVAAASFLRKLFKDLRVCTGLFLRVSSSMPPLLSMIPSIMPLASSTEIEAMIEKIIKDSAALFGVFQKRYLARVRRSYGSPKRCLWSMTVNLGGRPTGTVHST